MELGMIGLGRMGANMAVRLQSGGHQVVGFDPNAGALSRARQQRIEAVDSLAVLVQRLRVPRALWLMVPAGTPVDLTIAELCPLLTSGDIIVDGGNSNYKDSIRRAEELRHHGLHYLDVGTSGGIWGLSEGYSLMIGGERDFAEHLRPIFQTLAPAADRGWGYVGPSGAGHFVKMVHNGIEYGLMQAYAEGLAILDAKAEFGLDLHQVTEIWHYGSVIRSWLLDLAGEALRQNPALKGIEAYVADSGEGRWTAAEAIDLNVSAPVITLALLRRLRSREDEPFADRLLAVLRHQFGGHTVRPSEVSKKSA